MGYFSRLILVLFFVVSWSFNALAECDWLGKESGALSSSIEIGLWNVLKDQAATHPQAHLYLTQKDLWFFQEIGVSGIDSIEQILGSKLNVLSFRNKGRSYGTAIFSPAKPCSELIVDVDDEPVLPKVDKALLIQKYFFQAGGGRFEQLLVINVHLPLFIFGGGLDNGAYKSALRQIEQVVNQHCGPVLVAGDFNAWTSNRSNRLLPRMLQNTRMFEADFERPGSGRPQRLRLDRIFYRGLRVLHVESLAVTDDISDHNLINLAVQLQGDPDCH